MELRVQESEVRLDHRTVSRFQRIQDAVLAEIRALRVNRLLARDWKEKARAALTGALLDPDDSRSRDRVSFEDSPEIFITVPADLSYDGASDDESAIQPDHLMTLDEELRWLPASNDGQASKQNLDDFLPTQMLSQTHDLDKTTEWKWAAMRRSRIRFSVAASRVASLPRPKSVDELAIDRTDMRIALKDLSRGELRAVILRFAGCPLKSGERVQLMRALDKSRELRKRICVPVDIVSEDLVRAEGDYKTI